ncbi:MAG: sulfur carrier protein ThiS [Bacteroidia bacterium]|nr:sulfur carrier protein ThiS [Bacteroidia bacterium]MDW8333660.1 sulfur carrier protein ThiS [Bacteroidia bacterium]
MELTVNGEKFVFDGPNPTLLALIERLGAPSDGRGMAAAVNGKVAPRASWNVVELRPGDRVEIVTAFQGG